jgi:hypothetical protein
VKASLPSTSAGSPTMKFFEIDTPNISVTLDSKGSYRVEVDEDGNSRVMVRRGRVLVAANGRKITAEEGEIGFTELTLPATKWLLFAARTHSTIGPANGTTAMSAPIATRINMRTIRL